jgi:hypothetical protein
MSDDSYNVAAAIAAHIAVLEALRTVTDWVRSTTTYFDDFTA